MKKLLTLFLVIGGTWMLSPVHAQSTDNLTQAQINSLRQQGLSNADISTAASIVRDYKVGLDAVMVQYRRNHNWNAVKQYFSALRGHDPASDTVWNPARIREAYGIPIEKTQALRKSGLTFDDVAEAAAISVRAHVSIDTVVNQWRRDRNWSKVRKFFESQPNGTVWTREKLLQEFSITPAQIDSLRNQGLAYDAIATVAQISRDNKVSVDAVMAKYRQLRSWPATRAYFQNLRDGDLDDQMLRDRYHLSQAQINSLRKQGLNNSQIASAAQVAASESVSLDAVVQQWKRLHNWDKVRAYFRDLRDGKTDDEMLRNRYGLSQAQILSLRKQGLSNAEIASAAMVAKEESVSLDAVVQQWKRFHNWDKVRAYFDGLRGENRGSLDDAQLRKVTGLSQSQIVSLRRQGLSNRDIQTAAQISKAHRVSLERVMIQWRKTHDWNKVRTYFAKLHGTPRQEVPIQYENDEIRKKVEGNNGKHKGQLKEKRGKAKGHEKEKSKGKAKGHGG